jgi:hypothetical protein
MEKKMKNFALFSSAWRFATRVQNAEEAAARVPLENHLKGHATGDGDYIRKALHQEAELFS